MGNTIAPLGDASRRIYLAGPMTGYPDYNYPAFEEAATSLRSQGETVISPHELHDNDFSRPFDWYLRRDLTALLTCTHVAVLPGWNKSRGANLEVTVATGLDMPVLPYADGALAKTKGMDMHDEEEV